MAAVAAGLAIGVLAAVVGPGLVGGDDEPRAAGANRIATGEINSPDDLMPEDGPVPAGAGAASAEAAVVGFLDAEIAGDYETSFLYLHDAARAEYGTPAGWVSAHADVVPVIVDYELGERETTADGRETLTAVLALEPGLDQVVGLTPAEAVVRWDVVRGAEGWGVSLETTVFEPVHPTDDGVVPAATAWAESRRSCKPPTNEHDGLVGSPALARSLCDADGEVVIGEPGTLDAATAQPFFTAFGTDAVAAARVVRIERPAELAVVLVPIGDDWTVIGVLP